MTNILEQAINTDDADCCRGFVALAGALAAQRGLVHDAGA